MYYSSILGPVLAISSARLAAAETIVIEAGNVEFKPSSVNASVGDVLEFRFLPRNHSVVMGDLSNPCHPAKTGGFYSGFFPVDDGQSAQVFQVTINDTEPFVFYCSQNASSPNHCQSGMYGFVNQPNPDVIQMYSATANDSSVNISPDGDAFGGSLVANSNATADANATSTSSTPTATESVASTSTSSGMPPNNGGAGVKASGLIAMAVALMIV